MTATHRTDRQDAGEAELELLSAWCDGELDAEQHGAVLERLKRDPALRAQLEWFNLAGDALRSHEVAACHRPALVDRVHRALASEPVRVAPGARLRRHFATAVTVAAAAGVLVVVALPQLRSNVGAPAVALTAGTSQADGPIAPASPPATKAVASSTPTLDRYFVAHRELGSTGLMPEAAAYIRMSGEPER